MIDPVAPRHTAVTTAGMVPVTLANGPSALELTSAPKHKKNPAVGTKVVYKTSRIFIDQADARALSQGEEVRLCSCALRAGVDAEPAAATSDGGGAAVGDADGLGQLHHARGGDRRRRPGDGYRRGAAPGRGLQEDEAEADMAGGRAGCRASAHRDAWVPHHQGQGSRPYSPCMLLCRVGRRAGVVWSQARGVQLEEEDNFDDYVNRESWNEEEAIGDANMRALQQGEVLQLERKGYYRVDAAATPPGKPLVLFSIPDGRQKR